MRTSAGAVFAPATRMSGGPSIEPAETVHGWLHSIALNNLGTLLAREAPRDKKRPSIHATRQLMLEAE